LISQVLKQKGISIDIGMPMCRLPFELTVAPALSTAERINPHMLIPAEGMSICVFWMDGHPLSFPRNPRCGPASLMQSADGGMESAQHLLQLDDTPAFVSFLRRNHGAIAVQLAQKKCLLAARRAGKDNT
jgi:hypothetical protein